MQHDKILQHFTKDIWLLEKIFWKSADILYSPEYERAKTRLSKVYGKMDIDEVFPSVFDEEKTTRILDILFRVPQFPWQAEEETKKFLGIF